MGVYKHRFKRNLLAAGRVGARMRKDCGRGDSVYSGHILLETGASAL